MTTIEAGKFLLKAHFATPFYWDDPAYQLIKAKLNEVEIGDDREAAIKFAKCVYRHPDAQFVNVSEGNDKFFEKQKFGFWLGATMLGFRTRIERFIEEQKELIENLKKDLEGLN